MAVEYVIYYFGYELVKYIGDKKVYVLGTSKYYKDIHNALFKIKKRYERIKHQRFNRKKRNEAKMLARQWVKWFNEVEEDE